MDMTCTKTIKVRNWLTSYSYKCGKPAVYTVGNQCLCTKHHNKSKLKQTNWEQRKEYSNCTEELMKGGICMKLKGTCTNELYRLMADGKIWKWDMPTNKYNIPTELPANPELFTIKIF